MKKILSLLLAAVLVLSLAACGGNTSGEKASAEPDKEYGIKIYCDFSTDEAKWLLEQGGKSGFKFEGGAVNIASDPDVVVESARKNSDADILIGLDDMNWAALAEGSIKELKLADWTPSWAEAVRDFAFPGKAYGLTTKNSLMLCRTDNLGVGDKTPKFAHWAEIADCGYTYYRQGKTKNQINSLILYSMLYPYTDPASPAGGISIDGWKALWNYCRSGIFTGDAQGFAPLNKGYVQIAVCGSEGLADRMSKAEQTSSRPLQNGNWGVADIEDGSFFLTRYIGIAEKSGRKAAQTEQVKAFAEWFGSAEVQEQFAKEFGLYPVSADAAAKMASPVGSVYTLKNMTLTKAPGTDIPYVAYVDAHSGEWSLITAALGFFWTDSSKAPAEPGWDGINWASILN